MGENVMERIKLTTKNKCFFIAVVTISLLISVLCAGLYYITVPYNIINHLDINVLKENVSIQDSLFENELRTS